MFFFRIRPHGLYASVYVLAYVLSFFTLTHLLYAQTPSADLTDLESLIKEALNNNRDLAGVKAQWEAAKSRIPQSSALPNPTAGIAVMGRMLETPLGPQEDIYEFEQMIPFPGKLLEKRKMASAEAKAMEARYKTKEREIIFEVSQNYYDLFAVNLTLQTLEEVRGLLRKFESTAQTRYASQAGSQRDVAKAQAEVSEALERTFILRQQKNTLEALLSSLLNRKSYFSFDNIPQPNIPTLSATLEELLELAQIHRPELKEASFLVDKEQHAAKLAKLEYIPDISVGLEYSQIGKGTTTNPNDGRDAWMIPIKVTIPLWQNRLIPQIREAKRNLEATEAALEQTTNTSVYEVKDAYYRFTTAKQIVELYDNALLPETQLAFRSDQAGYEAGNTDILNLIDSERVYLNAKIAYYQALADTLKNFAKLEQSVGISLASQNLAPQNLAPQGEKK